MPCYPRLSAASHGLTSSVYTGFVELARTNAPEVFLLNVGDTYRPPAIPNADDEPSWSRRAQRYNYADVRGEPALLDAITHDLAARDRPVARHTLQVTSGATSGLDIACRALLSPGDEVIVLAPFWPLIRGIVSAAGAVPVELPFFSELRLPGFDLARALSSVLSAQTAALYVNHPHNPTGVVLQSAELDLLAEFVVAHNLWLICDEAYEQLYFGDAPPAALWLHPKLRERCVVAHTFSKTLGMAGARVGFLHGSESAMAAIRDLQTYATYCAAKPMQHAVAEALQSPTYPAWLAETRTAYAAAAQESARALGVHTPESGTFLVFDTRPYWQAGETAHELLARCARAGVVLTPGHALGSAYRDWARLCFTAVPPSALTRALQLLERVIRSEAAPMPR